MIFERHVPSIRRNSKEIEKYFERGPEIQKGVKYTTFVIFVKNERSVGRNSSEIERANKVVKKHINYSSFVKVGSAKGVKDISF